VFATAGEERADARTILARVLPFTTVFGGFNLLGGADLAGLAFVGSIAALLALIEWAQWANRWYEVTDSELRMRWGILSRDQRVVPFSRIQQVEHNQKLVHQVLGLAVVKIETAAEAGTTSVLVDALPVGEAERLRAHLLQRRREVRTATTPGAAAVGPWALEGAAPLAPPGPDEPAAPHPDDEPVEVVALSDWQLALAGATGSSLLLGLVWLFWPVNFFFENAELLPSWMVNRVSTEAEQVVADRVAIAVVGFGALLLLPIVAGLVNVVRWHGYRLAASGDDLLVRHGLFEVRRLTIPRRRIQHVTIADNPIRRRLGYVAISLQSAAGGNAGNNVLQVPLVRRDDATALLATLMRDDRWQPGQVVPRPPAALRRAIVRRTVVLLVLTLPLAVLAQPYGVLALALVPVGVPWGRAAHRRAGFAATDSTATIAKGVLLFTQELVALERLQSARTSSSPLQRRVDLATLHLDVAGSRFAPHLGDVAAVEAAHLRRELCRYAIDGDGAHPPLDHEGISR
jgi:putative membrane protein